MSRTERVLARHWRRIATGCALVAVFGISAVLWARVDSADRKAQQAIAESQEAIAEADLRGSAVSTLATDVRKLRTQIKSEGKTPVAPDPSTAVDDLPERATVPVPIPGPKGEKGEKGDPGQPGRTAPTITPAPGASGEPGRPGQDGVGTPGQDGADGVDGKDGADGRDGTNGADGTDGADGRPPAGWTYTDPQGVTYDCSPVDGFDPDAPRYSCASRSSPAPESPEKQRSGINLAALAPDRRRY